MDKVSILIVSRNSKDDLPRLFKSLKKLTYPKKFYEVVYVDDGSTDGSIEIAKKFGARTFRFEERQGRAKVRNFALKAARYPIIAWIDSDCEIVDKDWIQNMMKHLKGNVIGVAGNQLKPTKGLSRVAWYLPGMAVMVDKEKFASWAPTTSSLFRKKPILEAKFKDKLITAEDLELCWRLAKKGYKFKQIPEAEIIHHFRTSFYKFADQHVERGYHGAQLFHKEGKGIASKIILNSVFVLPILGAFIYFFPIILVPIFLAPLFFHIGLGNATGSNESFMATMWKYVKEEKSFSGLMKLIALQYIRTFTLAAGVFWYRLDTLLKK